MRIEWLDANGRHVNDDGKRPRKRGPRSHDDGEKDPWVTYRPGKGYFWGPKHPRAGEPAVFGIYKN